LEAEWHKEHYFAHKEQQLRSKHAAVAHCRRYVRDIQTVPDPKKKAGFQDRFVGVSVSPSRQIAKMLPGIRLQWLPHLFRSLSILIFTAKYNELLKMTLNKEK
jgi:hypothetical protein